MSEPGLRERKKQQTRRQIAEAAFHLFAERGFDNVPVAEVAQAANVSVATVFNYFANKEALVYHGMSEFETGLIAAVRDRPAGTSVVAAFRDYLLSRRGLLERDDPQARELVAAAARMTADSATLRTRERELFDECTRQLAEVIAADGGRADDDIAAWVVANALVGVHRALKTYVHRQVLAGDWGPDLVSGLNDQATRAFEALQRELGHHGTR